MGFPDMGFWSFGFDLKSPGTQVFGVGSNLKQLMSARRNKLNLK